jgi:hypothetical protein
MTLVRTFSTLLASFCFFGSIQALACGGWVLKDLQAKREIRFLVESLLVIDSANPDPTFMRTGRAQPSLINGDRLVLEGTDVILKKRLGREAGGKRRFDSQKIGAFKDGALDLGEGRRYVLSRDGSKITVKNGDDLEAEGTVSAGCETGKNAQIRRVAFYLAWKTLGLDPYAKPLTNWWW